MSSSHKSFWVLGMTCASCAARVERALERVKGVRRASVNLTTSKAYVVLEEDVPEELLFEAVRRAGYRPSREEPGATEEERYRALRRDLLLSIPLVALLLLPMLLHLHMPPALEALLSGAVIFWLGRRALRGATIALLHLHANMDSLISLGALASWATSLAGALGLPVPSFGMLGAMMVSLHLGGRALETALRLSATRELRSLLSLRPREATLVQEDGTELTVPAEAVRPGDLVALRPGDRVPVDGVVEEGECFLDESAVTGEPMPVLRGPGDEVRSGSTSLDGFVRVRATRGASDSFAARMAKLVEEAFGGKTPIQQMADRISGLFVPAVLLLSLLSALGWLLVPEVLRSLSDSLSSVLPLRWDRGDGWTTALLSSLSVLVVACPCALGIATPVALASGLGLASRLGILVRNGEAVQTASSVGALVLDKTGTLTLGRPRVVGRTVPEWALPLAASLASLSRHPLSRAVASSGDGALPVEGFREVPGEGIWGVVGGRSLFLGRPLDPSLYAEAQGRGEAVVELRVDGEVAGAFFLADEVRPGAKEAISRLRSRGLRLLVASGDSPRAVERLAKELGIGESFGGMRPEEKLNLIRALQGEGLRVAMAGDGLNDAAALRASELGIAMAEGSDLTVESADAVILRGGISAIADLFDLFSSIRRVVAQNLLLAFAYNALAVPLAVLGVLHPLVAELAMLLSSITVTANALRLKLSGGR